MLEDNIRTIVREELTKLLPTEPIADPDQMLTTHQVAELTTLSVPFFEMARSNGTDSPPYFRVGTRVVYRRGDVLDWMKSRKRGGSS